MQKSGISDKTGKSYINGISVTNSTITVTEATSLNFTTGGPITTTVQGSEEALISFNLDTVKSREALGLGTAALINTGTASGQIPILDAQGKLPESVIGDIALYDKFDIASADNINDIVAFINGITTGTTPKQGDMIFVLGEMSKELIGLPSLKLRELILQMIFLELLRRLEPLVLLPF